MWWKWWGEREGRGHGGDNSGKIEGGEKAGQGRREGGDRGGGERRAGRGAGTGQGGGIEEGGGIEGGGRVGGGRRGVRRGQKHNWPRTRGGWKGNMKINLLITICFNIWMVCFCFHGNFAMKNRALFYVNIILSWG